MNKRAEPAPGPALRDYACAELDAAIAALEEPGEALHEGVHRARKSLRRTRATLALGDRALGPGYVLLDRELHRINDGLSALRDAQALVETLERLLARKRAAATRQPLQQAREAAVAARAACAEAVLAVDPALDQRRALLAVLRAAVPALAWERLTPAAVRVALADSERSMQRAWRRVAAGGEDGDDEGWHRWRRRARRVSQQRRALAAAAMPVATLARPDATGAQRSGFDKRLTERLGQAQDLTLLLEHCGRDSPFSPADRAALKAYAKPELARSRKRIAAAAAAPPGDSA
ncbi:CHAD domain-containing protein [Lysobacter cavernae]|uniref:CHAD domain-containing protein n=1 Tax=Lysobacter cavernae TaxID=1685901 RepID=A0ABV7RM88_9GAMM